MPNAYLIMESTTEPSRPSNLSVEKHAGDVSFVRFDTNLQTLEEMNRNKRIYKKQAIVGSLDAPHLKELKKAKSWCGEAGHPLTSDKGRLMTIDPKSVSHKIVETSVLGNDVKGKIETLAGCEYGRQMTECILQGLEPAFSIRALSKITVDKNGNNVVAMPAYIITYDWVFLPSHKTAYIDDIRNVECITKSIDGEKILTEGFVTEVSNADILSYIKDQSEDYKIMSSLTESIGVNFTMVGDGINVVMESSDGDSLIMPVENKIIMDVKRYLGRL